MRLTRTISIVGVHCAGEVGGVIVGGVLNPPHCKTMYEKLLYFQNKADDIRQLLMSEPRGRPAMCMNLVLPPCDPCADAGLLIMESDEYPPMSGGNTISTATVLLDTGMVKMTEPVTKLNLETPAGLLDLPVDVPGLGVISVDIAWGGMHYAIVDARSVGLEIKNANGPKLIEVGERVKQAVRNTYTPVHPKNDKIREVTIVEFTEPVRQASDNTKMAVNTVWCLQGDSTGARVEPGAVLDWLSCMQEVNCMGTTTVGGFDAVLPTVKGSAWITGFKYMSLDPSDPFPTGFRVRDQWHMPEPSGERIVK
ncbi:hypothetical protein SI65_00394 [Aspergillus cristatus]|uniref:Proline racemase n=1 Tax=Aspergillus cristatus TaxID=573508 RepID=A0A1E3BPC1_ASPCR|nr:hypothetical protein SI65_00394 [Aspergillus cristatus]